MKITLSEKPNSLDPYKYDFAVNHPFQSSVYIRLISEYAGHGISPQLAASWQMLESGSMWTFKIRKDISFSNGEAIIPSDIVSSLTRIFFLMKKNKSKNDIYLNLSGIEYLDAATAPFEGLQAKGDEIIFHFKKPMPDLLDKLGFGFYSVIHKSSFDPQSGDWLPIPFARAITSGPYKVFSDEADSLSLMLNKKFPRELFSKNAFEKITFSFSRKEDLGADVLVGDSKRSDLGTNYFYAGNTGNSKIMYFFIHSWKLASSPLHDIELRKRLRSLFYSEFSSLSNSATKSFFPLSMSGIAEPVELKTSESLSGNSIKEIFFDDRRPSKNNLVNIAIDALEKTFGRAQIKAKAVKEFSLEKAKEMLSPDLPFYSKDIGFYATGIAVNNPSGDIRLMFSKEGINLPDTDGRIHKELAKENFSAQRINELLFEQAVIWPVAHYSTGVWAKSHIDLSQYNTLLPLGELQWIGHK